MRFLLTNDDGIHARGLDFLREEVAKEGTCLIVAPEREQSAVGHAITLTRPLMVKRVRKNGQFFGYAVAGTPADCVKIGMKELSDQKIDLVMSGINLGPNVGIDVIYSGTVSAATEAAILGVPSVAISLDTRSDDADFSFAAQFARKVALFVLRNREILTGVPLNVNVPALPKEQIKGVIVAKQGKAQLVETFEKRVDPRRNIYYWLAGETLVPDREESPDADTYALRNGMITITPIQFDLTRYDVMNDLRRSVARLFS